MATTAYPVSVHAAEGDAGVDFQLLVNGALQQFRISDLALDDRFGADGTAASRLKAFHDNWERIREVAAGAAGVPTHGMLLIEAKHF